MPRVHPAYDKDKFRELVLYIARRSEGDERFGAAKLNKLMYFIDFEAYATLGRAITGARYWRIQRGPAPVALLPVREELVESGEIEIRSVPYKDRKHNQDRVVAKRDPDEATFSAEERDVIDSVIQRFWALNGAEISQQSYKEPGVALADEQEDIPYGSVFINPNPWTPREEKVARDLARDRGLS